MCIRDRFYSVLKLFTGFVNAAFIAWKLIVINAITAARMPAVKNIHHGIDMRYAKSSNHLFIKYQETAKAGIAAKATSFKKSFDSNATIVDVSAPKTFRIPISLSLCMIANAER